jgi:hypothetical protein
LRKFNGTAKYRTDLAKYRTPVRIRSACSSQPCYLRHSIFLHAIACTFSSIRAARFYNTTTSTSTPRPPHHHHCLLPPANTMSLLPPPEASYSDLTTAFTSIQSHPKAHGYAIVKHLQRPTRVVYTCDRAGKYRSTSQYQATHESKQRKGTGTKKCECLIKVELRLDNYQASGYSIY